MKQTAANYLMEKLIILTSFTILALEKLLSLERGKTYIVNHIDVGLSLPTRQIQLETQHGWLTWINVFEQEEIVTALSWRYIYSCLIWNYFLLIEMTFPLNMGYSFTKTLLWWNTSMTKVESCHDGWLCVAVHSKIQS